MKNKKTIFVILIALLIVCLAFSLTACDPEDTGSGSGNDSGTSGSIGDDGSGSGSGNGSGSVVAPDGGSGSGSGTIDGSGSGSDSGSGDNQDPDVHENAFSIAYGDLEERNNLFISSQSDTLAVKTNGVFSQGTISATVTLSGTNGDNGIIFGLKNNNNLNRFWEHSGVYYYFFFISRDGSAYLGKVSNTQWIVCGTSMIEDFSNDGEYLLQVSRDKSNTGYDVIRCYVDGDLYVTYKDNNNIDGTGYGLRAGTPGTSYSEITISENIMGAETTLDDYIIASGSFNEADGLLTSATGNAIAEVKNGEFVYGTLSATMDTNGNSGDNGLIFSLTPDTLHSYWESNVSYYFFFISFNGSAYLGKVDNGTWTSCDVVPIPGYNVNDTYTLKVEKDSTSISGYVNDVCYVTYADSFPLTGTGYGVRAGAKGVSFGDIDCQSSGTIVETTPDDITLLNGNFSGKNGAVKSSGNENLALISQSFSAGTLSSNIKGVSTKRSGLIFSHSVVGGRESYYRFVTRREAGKVEIDKVVNGNVTNLYSNYLSAGYSTGVEYLFKVVVKDGVAYCYFGNNLYYNFELELTGTGAGIYAEGAGSQFRAYGISSAADIIKVDTLLFGHSYFELWSNWKNDLAALARDYDFGTYLNIGIGGSVASHWEKFKESLAVYDADRVIYMIGINDLTGGTSPQLVVSDIESTLDYLTNLNPNLEIVLLSVNHCPARNTIRSEISATNELMKQLCAKKANISYAELEYAFCDDGVNPDSYWFTDGLHPSVNGYVRKIVPAIKNALDGLDQPTLSPELQQQLLDQAKSIKKLSLTDYSAWSYRSEEWKTAKTYYNQGIALIDACTTVEAVEALDLSSVINNLKAIKRNTEYVYADMVDSTDCSVWETPNFKAALDSSTGGVYNVTSDGHRIVDNRQYTDMSFTFKLSDISNEFATVGILFRSKMISTLGVDGYLINIVTEPNYIQIWHLNGAYGSSGGNLTYIGGWVFPEEVEETLFRAVIKDGYCYIYTEENYQTKGEDSYGCSADLSYGGTLPVHQSGGIGILCWNSNNGATGKLLIDNIGGNLAETQSEEPVTDHTSTVVTALSGNGSDIHGYNSSYITYSSDNNTFSAADYSYKLHTGLNLDDFTMTVKATSDSDVSIAGFLFRTKKNTAHDGIDGYLMNYVSTATDKFIQIYYLSNCYNTDGSEFVCQYIGGWVYPGEVLGTTFEVSVEGTRVIITDGSSSVAVSLTGSDIGLSYTAYTEGGIGLVAWQTTSADLTIEKIKA